MRPLHRAPPMQLTHCRYLSSAGPPLVFFPHHWSPATSLLSPHPRCFREGHLSPANNLHGTNSHTSDAGLHSTASAPTACCVIPDPALHPASLGCSSVTRRRWVQNGASQEQQVVAAVASWKAGKKTMPLTALPYVDCLEIHQPGTGNLEGIGQPAPRPASFKFWNPGFDYWPKAQFVEQMGFEVPEPMLGRVFPRGREWPVTSAICKCSLCNSLWVTCSTFEDYVPWDLDGKNRAREQMGCVCLCQSLKAWSSLAQEPATMPAIMSHPGCLHQGGGARSGPHERS